MSGITSSKGGNVTTWRRTVIDGSGIHYETTNIDPNSSSFDQDYAIEQQKKAAAKAKQKEQDEILKNPLTGDIYEQWQSTPPLRVSSFGPPIPAQNIQFFISALVLNRHKVGVSPPVLRDISGASAPRGANAPRVANLGPAPAPPQPMFQIPRRTGGSTITSTSMGSGGIKSSSLGSPVAAPKITIGPVSGGSAGVRSGSVTPAGGASRMVVTTPTTAVPRSLNTNVATPSVRINTNVAAPTVKFTMPTVHTPTVSIKTPTVSIKTPTVRINTPTVRVSTVSVRTPTVRLPTVRAPVIRITVPTVRVPAVRVPTMSDIRLKRDIVALGRTQGGLQLYRYRYLWSEEEYVGVMAQEVLEVVPSAVSKRADGYLGVDYGRLGMELLTWSEWAARARPASYRPH